MTDEPKLTNTMPLPGNQYKRQILNAMARPTAMPMVCLWWDDQAQWCLSVSNDVKNNEFVRKNVSGILFGMLGEFGLLGDISKNKKD